MYNSNEFLWVERYRPQKLDDCILPEGLLKTFKSIVKSGQMRSIDRTTAWNFPQGGRQQWWPARTGIVVYNQWEEGRLMMVARTMNGGEVSRTPGGVYAFSPDGGTVYSLNFERLHALGGYGYCRFGAPSASSSCPDDDGLWSNQEGGRQPRLLISIRQIAEAMGLSDGAKAPAQYITHIVPSPSGARLCFLHRYLLPDGGINTSVCICDSQGSNLVVVASGFYSHFDWSDEDHLLIWARGRNRLQGLRNTHSSALGRLLRVARPIYRGLKRFINTEVLVQESYYLINVKTGLKQPFLPAKLTEDGHPSFLSRDRRWLLTDTYPDKSGYRNLFLVDCLSESLHDLGRLGTPRLTPRSDAREYLLKSGVEAKVLAKTDAWGHFNARSGYSCDFHPRFNRGGNLAIIDSMHSGRRGMYATNLEAFV